jgi:hypothetical protein
VDSPRSAAHPSTQDAPALDIDAVKAKKVSSWLGQMQCGAVCTKVL